jgi:MYXO-CTERM domain-containing protein
VCVEIGNDDEYRQRFCTSFCTLSEDGVEHSCETTNECLSTAGKFGVCASQDSCGGFYGGAQAVPLACCQVGGKGGAQAALLVLVVAALAGLRRRRRDRR